MEKLWDQIKKSVMDGVTTAAEKTEEYTKLGKAKLDTVSVKRKISKNFSELGGIVYEAINSGEGAKVLKTEAVTTLVDTLKELEEDLKAKEADIDDMKKKDDAEEVVSEVEVDSTEE